MLTVIVVTNSHQQDSVVKGLLSMEIISGVYSFSTIVA